jgi:iron(III) transport system ATP-binding protein
MSKSAGATPMIEVCGLEVRYGEVSAVNGISFAVGRGELLTLLGPSGCGKTTTLRAIAGLEQPFGGSIALDGTTVYSAAARRNVATEKRGVSMVFQSYAIWPHMNVFENVAYGLRVRKLPRAEVEGKVQHALDLVQMQDYASRPASKLSGGQQQRVAVARAIAFAPAIVLFDEPLSNLDAKLRAEMRVELRALQNRLSFTSVYVTHDQDEALTISDRVIVMNAGRIEQIGTPQDVCDRPRNRFVADFVGSANLISGRVRPGSAANGTAIFDTADGLSLRVATHTDVCGDEDTVALRSSYIYVGSRTGCAAANAARGRIERRSFRGDFIEYLVSGPLGQLIVRRPPTEIIAQGDDVAIWFAPEHCMLLQKEPRP